MIPPLGQSKYLIETIFIKITALGRHVQQIISICIGSTNGYLHNNPQVLHLECFPAAGKHPIQRLFNSFLYSRRLPTAGNNHHQLFVLPDISQTVHGNSFRCGIGTHLLNDLVDIGVGHGTAIGKDNLFYAVTGC